MMSLASLATSTRGGGRSDRRLHGWIMAGLAVLLVIAPLFFYPIFILKFLCFALFALAFNLLLGFGGLLSFGHAAFFGAAGYVCAHSAKIWGLTPEVAILLGTVTATLLGGVFGWIAIRRQGIYFAMITLALAQMVYFVALQSPFTGAEDGIQAVPRGWLFGVIDLRSDITLYCMVVVIFMCGLLFFYRVVHSPFGQVLKSIRENEARAISLGYDTDRYKLLVFVISAGLAGLAGATKVIVLQLASLTDVHWSMSGEVVLMTLVGGMGTIFGPIAGALIMVLMQSYLAHLGAWIVVIQGVIFILVVMLFREGVVGVVSRMLRRDL
ncbi:branched-chain amino acid ABC transporter permease [Pseudorhodoplanes sp.]|uniref:branched-chain amino acid ABC transporter permease n=1 Tax=Pseudorhodoplanes sp. TaxID=1934341 RepID=UPI003D147C57